MVEVLGRPILAYQIQWLQAQGVTDIIISCGYRHQVIQDYFGDGEKWNLHISYCVEDEPLGRGGGIRLAFDRVGSAKEPIIATNGDVITNLDLLPVIEAHRQSGALATIVLTPFVSPYGIVEVGDDDRVIGFAEKPDLPYWINGGIYIFSRGIYNYLPARGDHENSTFPTLAQQGLLRAYRSRAFWRAVDTAKDLTEVSRELERLLIEAFFQPKE